MTDLVTIENDHWRVGFFPSSGGSVAFGQVRIGEEWVDVLRPTPDEDAATPAATASYPLVPWSNRIRDGLLRFRGEEFQLRVTAADGTAIHGSSLEFPWEVVAQDTDRIVLEFDSRGYYGVNFPWDYVARFEYALDGPRFSWTMSVENADDAPFPAGLGHHPYFVRQLLVGGAAPSAEALLQINCDTGYALDNAMATGAAGEIPARADFREQRGLGQAFVDDCLTGRTSPTAATVEYPGVLRVDIEADDALGHVVVYIPNGQQFFAVEPVSNANDAFTLHAAGVGGLGVVELEPGQSFEATFSMVATPAR